MSGKGRLSIVGLGPGDVEWITPQAMAVLNGASDLVGYSTYLDLVPDLTGSPVRHASGNRVEIDRAKQALALARSGRQVALVTSGDPGIFAMASAVWEVLDAEPEDWSELEVEVVPGLSAMQAAAARVGAPLGHDFCVISLSDYHKSQAVIEKRLTHALLGDFVIALYNPASQTRCEMISRALALAAQHRDAATPVILAHDLGRAGERHEVSALSDVAPETIDMRTIVLIGSSRSRVVLRQGCKTVYTPRTYPDEPV